MRFATNFPISACLTLRAINLTTRATAAISVLRLFRSMSSTRAKNESQHLGQHFLDALYTYINAHTRPYYRSIRPDSRRECCADSRRLSRICIYMSLSISHANADRDALLFRALNKVPFLCTRYVEVARAGRWLLRGPEKTRASIEACIARDWRRASWDTRSFTPCVRPMRTSNV